MKYIFLLLCLVSCTHRSYVYKEDPCPKFEVPKKEIPKKVKPNKIKKEKEKVKEKVIMNPKFR